MRYTFASNSSPLCKHIEGDTLNSAFGKHLAVNRGGVGSGAIYKSKKKNER
jgi:hypothetical protein